MAHDNKHNEEHGDAAAQTHDHGPGRYVVIWLLLMVATVTTVVTGRMDLGSANLPLALFIATVKAALVVLFFMHLWDSEGINKLVFSVSILFVMVLLLGVFGDLLTRMPTALPVGAPAPGLEAGSTLPPGTGTPPQHPPAH